MDKESISRLVSAGMTHTCEETTPDSQIEQYITNPGARTVFTDIAGGNSPLALEFKQLAQQFGLDSLETDVTGKTIATENYNRLNTKTAKAPITYATVADFKDNMYETTYLTAHFYDTQFSFPGATAGAAATPVAVFFALVDTDKTSLFAYFKKITEGGDVNDFSSLDGAPHLVYRNPDGTYNDNLTIRRDYYGTAYTEGQHIGIAASGAKCPAMTLKEGYATYRFDVQVYNGSWSYLFLQLHWTSDGETAASLATELSGIRMVCQSYEMTEYVVAP